MRRAGFLSQQIANLAKWKRGKAITMGLFLKLALLLVLVLLTLQIYHQSRLVENKMKGFDPFEILGLTPGSTLREVKKAYRYSLSDLESWRYSTTPIATKETQKHRPSSSSSPRAMSASPIKPKPPTASSTATPMEPAHLE